ncbi:MULTISPECIES: LptM family lipoprotein [Elizabethkingia]|nr:MULTISPECIES: hypothetical protein [Elizabethkingia]MDE5451100.1 hypothetical protein [Elizabethkingia meningoseptica]
MRKKIIKLTGILFFCFSLTACGQKQNTEKIIQQQSPKTQTMDVSKITNEKVKGAIEALQAGDKSWYAYFTENPVMTDDGNTIDFKSFFANALGKERFLSIDRVENNGLDIYGNFEAGKWGTFRTYFKFHQAPDGKFNRLDIGQAR